MKSIISIAVVVVLLCCFVGTPIIRLCGGFNDSYSDGVREGDLMKMSVRGIVWKSGEGQLKLSDFSMRTKGSSSSQGNMWEFSCRDEVVINQLKDATGKRVKLGYKQWMIHPAQISTEYEVTSIEVLN